MTQATRPFGFWTATALVVGGMIGSGIFVLPAQLAPYGWTGLIAWLIAIAGAILLALVLARLIRRAPGASGIVAICGDALGPLAGVVLGWSYWISCWSTVAVLALTAIRYLALFVPAIGATPHAQGLWAIALIWLITAINLGGMRLAGGFQIVTTLIKLLPLLIVSALIGALALAGGTAFDPAAQAPFAAGRLTSALTLAFFALLGFEAASAAAERVRDPARNVARAGLFGLALTGLLYIVVSIGISLALPPAMLAASGAPFALFVEQYWGQGAGLVVAGFAAIAAIGAMNGWVLIQNEILLGMARADLIPRWIGRTDARDIPVGLLLASSLLASLLVLSSITRSLGGLLDFTLRMTTASTLWLYIGACIAALALRISPLLSAAGLAFALWVLWGAGLDAIGLSLVLMLTAIPVHLLHVRSRAARAA